MQVFGVVLAGGKSSRMGEDKRFLLINNQYFLDSALNLLKNLNINDVFISGMKQYKNFSTFEDISKGKGPLYGIYSSLINISINSLVLFIPVDMPFLTEDILNNLLKYSSGYEVVYYKNNMLPIVIYNSFNVQQILKNLLSNSDKSIKTLIQECNNNELDISFSKDLLNNINYKTEYLSLIKRTTIT